VSGYTSSTGREAALRRWAFTPDRTAATSPAREAIRTRYERRVDPDGTMHPDERARRADALLRADMIALARRRGTRRR
jgi:hypothetical protein